MSKREAQLEAELKAAHVEIKLLKEKVDALARVIYGQKSERIDPNQLMLLKELEGKIDKAPAATELSAGATKKARGKAQGPRLPEDLPVKEVVVDPDEVIAEPQQWRLMGQEVSEQLDYEPARFCKRRLIRRKYVRKDQPFAPPVIAPLPPGLQERCLAAPSLIAQVVASKYADHLPLYRQEQIYKRRHGVSIPRQTLCRWVAFAAYWMKPVYDEMIRQQQGSPYLQVDETPVDYLKPGKGKTGQGYFWVSSEPNGDAIYHWHPSRAADCINKVIHADFSGTLQCDGYRAYASFQKQRAGPLELAACWAHARRKFFEAKERDPKIIAWILHQIAQLYQIEKQLRQHKAGTALRTAVRASKSASILKRIKKALILLKPRYLPKSKLGKAIDYALGQWQGLEVFASNGKVEIDNNAVENAIRPSAIGKKNWLFIGSENSGLTSAILYTIIESAKRHKIEPYNYILHLLNEFPKATNHQIPQFTPKAIAKKQLPKAA